MSKFSKLIKAAQYKIIEGSEYCWNCFGLNARFLDFQTDDKKTDFSIVFDADNQTVYLAELHCGKMHYRWINPKFKKEFLKEAKNRNFDLLTFMDDEKFTDFKKLDRFMIELKNYFS